MGGGTVKSAAAPTGEQGGEQGEIKWEQFEDYFADYEIEYPLAATPAGIRIEQQGATLEGVTCGLRWDDVGTLALQLGLVNPENNTELLTPETPIDPARVDLAFQASQLFRKIRGIDA